MNVTCPRCLDRDATVAVDVRDGDTMTCGSCSEEFTVADVVKLLDDWKRVVPWLLAHPARTAM